MKGLMNRMLRKAETLITKSIAFFGAIIGAVIFGSGWCVLGYQVLFWFKNEEWVELPLLVAFFFLVPQQSWLESWLNNPQSWYGLHKLLIGILEVVPLSLFLIIFGGMFGGCLIYLSDELSTWYKDKAKIK